MAVDMGGVLIKVGQFLSTRVDVLPPEFTSELVGLQDEVPPVNFNALKVVAEADFGMPLSQKFVSFDPEPLASASLGQVHRARVYKSTNLYQTFENTREIPQITQETQETVSVVVKIQRPNNKEIIETDLSALKRVGTWLQKYPPIRKRADIPALFNEFSRTLYEEIDYISEGKNAEIFAGNFQYEPQIRVPRVVWSHTTMRVLTLENVWGIKISEYETITNSGINRSDVAGLLIDTYLKQIFDD